MTEHLPRSPAAATASRRNGARSKGPRTSGGKAASARNARKHGLFCADSCAPQGLSPSVAALAAALAEQIALRGDAGLLRDRVVLAATRLEQATGIVRSLRTELGQMLASEEPDSKQMTRVLVELVRMGRYERRFRGQRDRALRALLKPPPVVLD